MPHKKASFSSDTKVFSGSRINVHRVPVSTKQGTTVQREVVVHPGAVTILPLLDDKHIVMIRNYRHAIGKELWELPAGTLDKPGESPVESANRELIEETGYEAKIIEPLVTFYTTPGFCNEIMYSYVAKDLTEVGQALDETEEIQVEIVSWKKALDMLKDGTIDDGKTITILLYYQMINAGKSRRALP